LFFLLQGSCKVLQLQGIVVFLLQGLLQGIKILRIKKYDVIGSKTIYLEGNMLMAITMCVVFYVLDQVFDIQLYAAMLFLLKLICKQF
jgi:ABC-type multidrug transport system permease subunit